jgi:competence protein ComEA
MSLPRGLTFLLGILLLLAGFHYGRAVLPYGKEPSAFFSSSAESRWIMLGDGFPEPGVHQFIDEQTPRTVIQMAFSDFSLPPNFDAGLDRPLINGELLEVKLEGFEITGFSRKWMPASQRIVLKIPLHIDRMSSDDWMALPGIGPVLAGKIEEDRQKNGDFSTLAELKRVSGIGEKRIEAWKDFF